MSLINNSIHFAPLSTWSMGQGKPCLKQENNSAADVPEFRRIDPSGSECLVRKLHHDFFPLSFYPQEEKGQ